MAKKQLQEAVDRQAAETHQEIGDQTAPEPAERSRTERLVIRLTKDELRRLRQRIDQEQLPLSTGARAVLMRYARETR